MLDKQFTIISGTTCIVVLLMLLARTDAAPQVGEIDAMQETVTSPGAPSDSFIDEVYELYLRTINSATYCKYKFDRRKCRLKVGVQQPCEIELDKGQMKACKKPKERKVLFKLREPRVLEFSGLELDLYGYTVPSSISSIPVVRRNLPGSMFELLAQTQTSLITKKGERRKASIPIQLDVHMVLESE
eukprot:Nk52_evm1s912 gene=Nk52_evmTU1s912